MHSSTHMMQIAFKSNLNKDNDKEEREEEIKRTIKRKTKEKKKVSSRRKRMVKRK